MHIVSLITDPAAPALDAALPEALRNAFGGGGVTWLAPDIAAEFPVDRVPGNFWDVWAELQGQRVDLAVQPAAGRRRKMLLADMDSTMIGQECIDELADEAGVGAHVADITARAMNGELNFEAALRERVGLLKGLPESVIGKVLEARITLAPGGRELVATMRANRAYAALVSGGFTAFTGAVAARLGIGLDEVMAVGDGANDLGMLHLAGAGVALHAKPAVAAECDLRINHGDLTALLYLQGYDRDEFVPV